MKIAIYTIAKNEAHHVDSWYEAVKGADYLVVADTGSTDSTFLQLLEKGVDVIGYNDPFRFDHALIFALNHIPLDADICIRMDMDEKFDIPNWREVIEAQYKEGTGRYLINYVSSLNEDGTPATSYLHSRIHSRQGFTWIGPTHEYLDSLAGSPFVQALEGVSVLHYPTPGRPRKNDLPLLQLAVEERPDDPRWVHYLGREYYLLGDYVNARPWLEKHAHMEVWFAERAESFRLLAKMVSEGERLSYLLQSLAFDRRRRDIWVDLASYYYSVHDWDATWFACAGALRITERDGHYMSYNEAWGSDTYDMAAQALYHINLTLSEKMVAHGQHACDMHPDDTRLHTNMYWYKKSPAGVLHSYKYCEVASNLPSSAEQPEIFAVTTYNKDSEERYQNLLKWLFTMRTHMQHGDITGMVVVDSSPDPLPDNVLSSFTNLTYLRDEVGGEFSRSRLTNTAVCALPLNSILLFIDSDCVLSRGSLSQMRDLIIGGYTYVFAHDGSVLSLEQNSAPVIINPPGRLMLDYGCPGYGFAMRTLKFIEAGGMNEEIVGYGPEDIEFISRCHKLGYSFARPDFTLVHSYHPASRITAPSKWDIFYKVDLLTKQELEEYILTSPYLIIASRKEHWLSCDIGSVDE